MQMSMSLTQSAVLLLLTILSLAVSSRVARYPQRTFAGVALGVITGLVLIIAMSYVVGFLGYVLPFGQIDFWLASWVNSILG